MHPDHKLGIILALVFAAIGAVIALVLLPFLDFTGAEADVAAITPGAQGGSRDGVRYRPPRPQDAPAEIRAAVLQGQQIIMETRKYAGRYAGNDLDCRNCHFDGGLTSGGRNGGISLVGAAARYPTAVIAPTAPGAQTTAPAAPPMDLTAKINDCFRRNLSARAVPPDGPEMSALVAYLQWISRGIPIYADVPWLGLPPTKIQHKPDANAGGDIYLHWCTMCHGNDGQGTAAAPPVWGNRSFSDASTMAAPPQLATFIHLNMPRESPALPPEKAMDVAAFIAAKPRPGAK